jgi:arylsulfatase A-like enzyme
VLFVVVDDLNDWVGALGGHPQAATPNIDRLARESLLFTNAHAPSPLCNPSRVAVLTGIRPSTSGVYENEQELRTLLPDALTLPQAFRASGYEVLGAGKVFHTPDLASWDEFFPQPYDPRPLDAPVSGIQGEEELDWGPLDVGDAQMGDAKVVDWAISRLQRGHRRPFFLACGLFRPHLPFYAPRAYFDRHPLGSIALPAVLEGDLADVPEAGAEIAERGHTHDKILDHHQWEAAVQGYLAATSFADAEVGRLLDALDASEHAGSTIVVLWSDNGWHLGEKHHWQKSTAWEESTRVPLLVRMPGSPAAGQRSAEPVSLMDLYPTLLELCNLPVPAALEGESLLPFLLAPDATRDRPALTTLEAGLHTLRSRDFRYIRYPDGSEELYDHRVDPDEWSNLADDPGYGAVKADLARWLPR